MRCRKLSPGWVRCVRPRLATRLNPNDANFEKFFGYPGKAQRNLRGPTRDEP